MKKLLMLILASGFVSLAAQAQVGQNKDKVDCSKVVEEIKKKIQDSHASNEAPATEDKSLSAPISGTGQ
jgi:hypothetical protein